VQCRVVADIGGICVARFQVFRRVSGALAGFCALALPAHWAIAADLNPGPPPAPPPYAAPYAPPPAVFFYDPNRFELRLGAFEVLAGPERHTFDINPELVAPRLPFFQDQWWGVFVPRPHLGALVNLEGKTSAVYAGGLWSFPLPFRTFFELFVDGAVHDGYKQFPPPGRTGLGCPALFHVGGSLGYAITEHWTAMVSYDHLSDGHGIFGISCAGNVGSTPNPGLNDWGARIGYSF
jgi:lipid A 3-O-deacylase